MKKLFLIVVTAILIFCSSCNSNDVPNNSSSFSGKIITSSTSIVSESTLHPNETSDANEAIDISYLLDNWYYHPNSDIDRTNSSQFYEIKLEENGKIVMTTGAIDGGYSIFMGIYMLTGNEITFAVISHDDISIALVTGNDALSALADASHYMGKFTITYVDNNSFRLTGTFVTGEIDLTFTRGTVDEYIQNSHSLP